MHEWSIAEAVCRAAVELAKARGAKRIVERFRGGTRVPMPVRLAHKLSLFPKAEREP